MLNNPELVVSSGFAAHAMSTAASINGQPRHRFPQSSVAASGVATGPLGYASLGGDVKEGNSHPVPGDPEFDRLLAASDANWKLYKTELCRGFMQSSSCRYGDKCRFSHGLHELRATVKHEKYKTQPCKKFNSTGHCRYGARCRFIHGATIHEDNVALFHHMNNSSRSGEDIKDGGPVADPSVNVAQMMQQQQMLQMEQRQRLNLAKQLLMQQQQRAQFLMAQDQAAMATAHYRQQQAVMGQYMGGVNAPMIQQHTHTHLPLQQTIQPNAQSVPLDYNMQYNHRVAPMNNSLHVRGNRSPSPSIPSNAVVNDQGMVTMPVHALQSLLEAQKHMNTGQGSPQTPQQLMSAMQTTPIDSPRSRLQPSHHQHYAPSNHPVPMLGVQHLVSPGSMSSRSRSGFDMQSPLYNDVQPSQSGLSVDLPPPASSSASSSASPMSAGVVPGPNVSSNGNNSPHFHRDSVSTVDSVNSPRRVEIKHTRPQRGRGNHSRTASAQLVDNVWRYGSGPSSRTGALKPMESPNSPRAKASRIQHEGGFISAPAVIDESHHRDDAQDQPHHPHHQPHKSFPPADRNKEDAEQELTSFLWGKEQANTAAPADNNAAAWGRDGGGGTNLFQGLFSGLNLNTTDPTK